jgi:hypothetical protein
VPDVRYRIDLTGLEPVSDVPHPLRPVFELGLEL